MLNNVITLDIAKFLLRPSFYNQNLSPKPKIDIFDFQLITKLLDARAIFQSTQSKYLFENSGFYRKTFYICNHYSKNLNLNCKSIIYKDNFLIIYDVFFATISNCFIKYRTN